MKTIFASQSSRGSLMERTLDEDIKEEMQKAKGCEHKSYCCRPQNSMKCIFGIRDCNVKKFYDRYGDWYNQMGVGI